MVFCRRLNGIIRHHIMKGGVDIQCFSDISSEVYVIMQMKMLKILDSVSSFYSVAFRVSELVVASYRKKDYNTVNGKNISLDAPALDDGDNSAMLEILSYEITMADFSEDIIKRVDLSNAKTNLTNKLGLLGWPEDVPRVHKRIGRPRK
ncbi:hypothetical protein BLL52_4182 [Rhodoferax antarcticus ANT.BR]|uniref:Uncharacterized protein n=2 Tax=Rhodoferax antarcticus TaxID=81479 RepID=A0A1Q8Y9H5_9BURK|nr:hypothetical protein BLL52_4182 [Rhodoferax antarcticus ANT.BR]